MPLDSFKTLCEKKTTKKTTVQNKTKKPMQMLNDPTHPMKHYFDNKRSNRSGRYLLPETNTYHYKASFLLPAL